MGALEDQPHAWRHLPDCECLVCQGRAPGRPAPADDDQDQADAEEEPVSYEGMTGEEVEAEGRRVQLRSAEIDRRVINSGRLLDLLRQHAKTADEPLEVVLARMPLAERTLAEMWLDERPWGL